MAGWGNSISGRESKHDKILRGSLIEDEVEVRHTTKTLWYLRETGSSPQDFKQRNILKGSLGDFYRNRETSKYSVYQLTKKHSEWQLKTTMLSRIRY